MSLFMVLAGVHAGPLSSVAKAGSKPKAVIIVGPTGSSTDAFLADAQEIANQAENAGMDVTRVFHPHATWSRVLNTIQGANLVVYMGHGNGWPSPYAPFQERTKDGFGLDGYDGASKNSVTYYGANPIRSNIRLANNAIVVLVHACYASGNGEPGMPFQAGAWQPNASTISRRASSMQVPGRSSPLLAAEVEHTGGAHEHEQDDGRALRDECKRNVSVRLDRLERPIHRLRSDARNAHAPRSAPELWLLSRSDRWFRHDCRAMARRRTGGGDDGGGTGTGGGDSGGTTTTAGAPSITNLSVISTDGGGNDRRQHGNDRAGSVIPAFHPNGDGLQDKIIVTHTLSESAYLDVRATSSTGNSRSEVHCGCQTGQVDE
jgi:hypothetical protein